MAFQVSPGVNVSEIDATNVVPAVSTSDAGFAAAFLWGPADKITTVTSEVELAKYFGKPSSTDVEKNWHVASNFLAYAGSLNVVRTLGSEEYNAADVTTDGVISALSDTTPTPSNVAGWEASQSATTIDATSTSGSGLISGTGKATFSIVTDSGGLPTVTIVTGGTGFIDGDTLVLTDPGSTAYTATITVSTVTGGIKITNEDDFDAGATTGDASFVARYAGALGNSIRVRVAHQSGYSSASEFTTKFDRPPGTSAYVNARGGAMLDEIHILVEDADGKISGTKDKILEKYDAVSLATDAKDAQGNSNYWKDVLRRDSQYIYGTGQWDSYAAAWEGKDSNTSTQFDNSIAVLSITLAGGNDDTVNGNTSGRRNDTTNEVGYQLFADAETSDISILITGVDDDAATLGKALIDIASARKDCIATLSPDSTDVVSNDKLSDKTGKVTSIADGINSSSYGVMDSGWKRTYNRYTDQYVDIPLNGDVAGLMVQTDQSNDAWWSPAGFSRGGIKNVVKLWYNPDKNARDTLYKASVNPVVAMPGQGTILFGDKTLLKKASAFDRINVRRLFIVLEKAISRAAKSMLFEFNDEFTRSNFRNMVEPFLNGIKAKRGIHDYKVVCDTSNNTGEVIDRNEFVGDIFIKPARSINFIQLNFVAVRTGVSFSEVAG